VSSAEVSETAPAAEGSPGPDPGADPAPRPGSQPEAAAPAEGGSPAPPSPPSAGEPGDLADRDPALARASLFLSAFVVATCGLVYELVAGAMASYLLGDSVTQFSLVIGVYLSAMGLGSWLSRFLRGDLLARFIQVELVVGVIGGVSSVALFASYAYLGTVRPLLFTLVTVIGTLVGLEIPVLMRILKDEVSFADLVARVLAFDYLGALAASLMFPLLLVPALGLPRTAFAFGLLNAVVALALTQVFARRLGHRLNPLRAQCLVATGLLVAGLVLAERAAIAAEQSIYDAPVLIKRKTPYQTIVVTRWRADVRLLLDGHLQFSSVDEHRYHEALVHPAVASVKGPVRTALVIGGGDGMALRELLRYPSLERATLVDLDPVITQLFTDDPLLSGLNSGAYKDPRVRVVNADGMKWLESHSEVFDVVVIDLPDPRNYSLGKLYTRGFYRLIHRHLARGGALALQATSPFGSPGPDGPRGSRAYWCIERTLADAGYTTHPYRAHVPSFGEWGFVLALPTARDAPEHLAPGADGLSFLDDATLQALFAVPPDLRPVEEVDVNRLNDQVLVGYYEREWGAGRE
jgi:spermidine synthase